MLTPPSGLAHDAKVVELIDFGMGDSNLDLSSKFFSARQAKEILSILLGDLMRSD